MQYLAKKEKHKLFLQIFFPAVLTCSRCLKPEQPPWTIKSMPCVKEGKTTISKECLSLMIVEVLSSSTLASYEIGFISGVSNN